MYIYYKGIRQCSHDNVSIESGTTYRLSSYGLRTIFDSDIVQFRSYTRLTTSHFDLFVQTSSVIVERYRLRYDVIFYTFHLFSVLLDVTYILLIRWEIIIIFHVYLPIAEIFLVLFFA